MKLTKKNARRQKAIQKALASGKGLDGLLVGLAAATVASGCNGRIPFFSTAGKTANHHNEASYIFVTDGKELATDNFAGAGNRVSAARAIRTVAP